MNHPEISGTLEQLSLGRHEEENLVKDSHLGDKKYHYLFLRALSKGLSSLFTGSSEEFERRNRSSRGLPMSALQPSSLVPLAWGQGLVLSGTPRKVLGWASPFGLMLLTRMGHTAPLPSPLSYSGPSSFSLTHIFIFLKR